MFGKSLIMKKSATIIPVSSGECQKNSWKSYLKSAFSNPVELLNYLQISEDEHQLKVDTTPDFALRVPLPFAEKMAKGQLDDPLLMQVMSLNQENQKVPGYSSDPLQEQTNQRPGLLHKYHGRVLMLLTGSCAVNCRYCFRRHFPYQSQSADLSNLQSNLNYIRDDTSITEVILSGGDPLIASDAQLESLIKQIESIPQVKRLRIHTRLPVVIPQRVTSQLISLLADTNLQTSMVIHANHPNEIDDFTGLKLQELVQSGTSLFNQSVLLKGINDNAMVLSELSQRLFQYQIIPYYLHLLDPVAGSAHFFSSKQDALAIKAELQNQLPGYLVPKLALEEPHKPSKTIISG